MISKKELQYVELWASKIPMPGYEYSLDVLKKIEQCYNLYKSKYKDKEYSFLFSNGEEIEFEILAKNLCHMLGIDYKNISNDFFDLYRQNVLKTTAKLKSYELLEAILENKEKVAEEDNNPLNRAKVINYYKSAVKCAIFQKFSDFEKFNFAAINCINDKSKDYNSEKLLFVPSNESLFPYFFMGIRKDNLGTSSGNFIVSTLLAPEDSKIFFENQEVMLPIQIILNNQENLKKISATAEEKLQLITMYKNILNMYGISNRLNIYSDYECMLNDIANKKVLTK